MPQGMSKYINLIILIGDLVLLNLSIFLAFHLHLNQSESLFSVFFDLIIIINLLWLLIAVFNKNYNYNSRFIGLSIIKKLLFSIVFLFLLIGSYLFVNKTSYYSSELLITTFGFILLFITFWRVLCIISLKFYRSKGYNFRRVIIVGYGELAEDMRSYFKIHPENGFKFLGFFSNSASSMKVRGRFEDVKTFSQTHKIDEIYCCLPYTNFELVKDLVEFGENNLIKVKLIADYRGLATKGFELQKYDHIPVLNVNAIPLDEIKNRLAKRIFDIAFSLGVIVFILSWVVPIVAFLIKVESRGPVFFKQKRTGKDNKPFWCYKFRTMRINADSDQKQAIKNDSRITRFGSFFRKSSIDELPQFFNVLMGDMSVVGPRPHMLKHTEEYSQLVDKFMARHMVKPGITGLAQARGFRGETKELYLMKNRVKLDRFYISNWNFLLDVKIIVMTLLAMYKGDDNAY
jgi:putative colanic acid biosysnthesis UDP-glucose lipid carrier transferase